MRLKPGWAGLMRTLLSYFAMTDGTISTALRFSSSQRSPKACGVLQSRASHSGGS